MTRFFEEQRARRFGLPDEAGRRELWRRIRTLFSRLSRPRGARDVALPEWLHLLVGVADDGLRIPGTRVRLGLDALLGTLLPGGGDALGGVTSALVMYVAWQRGAPRDLLFRMLGNATIDVAFGSVPVVGDIFDLGFHANRRNLTLLEDFLRRRSKAERASRLSAVLAMGLLIGVMLLALAAAVGLIVVLWPS
jgi:hypothetical protein